MKYYQHKNYNISSIVIIKTPRACTIKCYSGPQLERGVTRKEEGKGSGCNFYKKKNKQTKSEIFNSKKRL